MRRTKKDVCSFGLTVLLVCAGSGVAHVGAMQHSAMQQEHRKGPSARNEMCRGFLVLGDGRAVMSGVSDGGHGGHSTKHRDVRVNQETIGQETPQPPALHHGGPGMEGLKHHGGMKDHPMGMEPGKGRGPAGGALCVPLDPSKDSWAAVSGDRKIQVTATSIRGALAHNSRENEAFELRLMDATQPIEDAEVVFIARMPHHDRSTAGGHGLANDPDGRGLEATASGKGRYIVDPADFSMPGPWLFEIRVKSGDKVSKAYFATLVGESSR